ncbi:Alpha-(1,3)-fucosyltransferase C [Chionoecetes opilio]|uniref:Fucosyltransferase n=1 Tax=Chionoecetes opilio TaxID=41210 RepID=A0A8J5CR60_CHIOP|nr:Alpha-(1,3)-fucosyltransferase C [Chionoecetes opilio]
MDGDERWSVDLGFVDVSAGREFYGWELRQHLQVDVFGKCGELKCGQSHHDLKCYSTVLRPNYKFYLAFENNLCEDYITEKVWLPLHYGLVPVVYGGARYAHFLPPHSYVDATYLTPLQLARLLSSVGSSPKLYGLYHLWRKYWKVLLTPPLCELCLKLHLKTSNNKEALQGQTYGTFRRGGGELTTARPTTHRTIIPDSPNLKPRRSFKG